MFLSDKYILANELTTKMEIHIANISNLIDKLENENKFDDFKKLNSCTFLKRDSINLPKNIKEGIEQFSSELHTFTDKLPSTFLYSEYGLSKSNMIKSKIFKEEMEIYGKTFYVFTDEFIKKVKNCTLYILPEIEAKQCLLDKEIIDYIKISKNKCITWYTVF